MHHCLMSRRGQEEFYCVTCSTWDWSRGALNNSWQKKSTGGVAAA